MEESLAAARESLLSMRLLPEDALTVNAVDDAVQAELHSLRQSLARVVLRRAAAQAHFRHRCTTEAEFRRKRAVLTAEDVDVACSSID